MSQRSRSPLITSRRRKPPHPSPSPRRRAKNKSKAVINNTLKRCSSAPLLSRREEEEEDDSVDHIYDGQYYFKSGGRLFRPQTFSEAFVSSPSLFAAASSPKISYTNQIKEYDKGAKVVVNVTVEGSSGPVRAMVKLGSTVEETIGYVVDKYRQEGRSPEIDPDVASSFQLHLSYFSLQSLDKSEVIGDVSSRSFYLRKSNGASALSSFCSESDHNLVTRSSAPSIANPPLLLPSFIARKISKIVRRAHRLWKIVVCSQ